MSEPRSVFLGITGASGSCYAARVLDVLIERCAEVHLVFTETGRQVALHELKKSSTSLAQMLREDRSHPRPENLKVHHHSNLFASIASGSNTADAGVIVPCSMGTLARVAQGMSSNLLERTADVLIKERRPLIVVPRESPMSTIHLRHLVTLSEVGAQIVMPSPGFYHDPQSMDDLIDFVAGRILACLGFKTDLMQPWGARKLS